MIVSYEGISIILQPDELTEKIEKGQINEIIAILQDKKLNTTEAKHETLKTFDLPKNEPICYTSIFQDNDYSSMVNDSLAAAQALPNTLQAKYNISNPIAEPQIT